jgi:3-phosphoshikimate 1-carboxyvinyltransferase
MMDIKITKPVQGGTIGAIASKSQAHRLLISAALSSKESQVVCSETNNDIDATVRCLNALGADIIYESGAFSVRPVTTPVIGERLLDVGESGATLRFMLPISCALGADATFNMSGRLPMRPLTPLYEELNAHGCAFSPQGMNPLRQSGQLKGGNFTIPGNVSSQFISGLLFALPLLNEDSLIKITGELESKPYIDMTISALKEFGIEIKERRHGYIVKGKQRFVPQHTVTVEGDWSNAAFWLCAGAIDHITTAAGTNWEADDETGSTRTGKRVSRGVTVTNLALSSLQGDKRVLEILERFGALIEYGYDSVTVQAGDLKGIDIDAGDIPDLVPILAAVASVADGKTTIHHAERLRMKESDRLKTTAETLRLLGADIAQTQDGLVIKGKRQLTGGTIDSHNDHRIAMTAAVASAVCAGPVIIKDAEAVNKSYPGFFRDFTLLGGNTEEVI